MKRSSIHRTVWTSVWFPTLAVGLAWATLVLPLSAVVAAWVTGVTAVCGVRLAALDGGSVAEELREWAEPAAWAGLTSVSAIVASVQRPGSGVLLVAAVVGSSPTVVGQVRAHTRGSGASPEPPAADLLQCLTLDELDALWRTSDIRLRACQSPEDVLVVVQRREQLLDELDRRYLALTERARPDDETTNRNGPKEDDVSHRRLGYPPA